MNNIRTDIRTIQIYVLSKRNNDDNVRSNGLQIEISFEKKGKPLDYT